MRIAPTADGLGVAMVVFMATSVACSSSPVSELATSAGIDRAKLVDLSYTYDVDTIYWPNAEGFRHRKDVWAIVDGSWYAAGEFATAEHGGTHIDSPVHFAKGKATVDQIAVHDLVAPVSVIDVSMQATSERDYRITPGDLETWESEYGRINRDSIVVFRTGWGQHWPDKLAYMGSDTPGDTANLHFPGLSEEAARVLVERGVSGVGVDTASLDYGPSTDFIAHKVLNGAGIYGIENIANAEQLPAIGATLIVLPLKVAEGSGSPARVVALLP